MSGESGSPSDFEQWERSRKLEIEMLTAVSEAEKRHAEALHEEARAGNLNEATYSAEIINNNLAFTLQAAKKREWKLEKELELIRDKAQWIGVLRDGRIVSPQSCSLVWTAFSWFTGNARTSDWQELYSQPAPADGWQPTTKARPANPPSEATLGQRINWLRANFALPVGGTPLHAAILKLLAKLESAEASRIAELEAWREKIHTATHQDIAALKEILGVALIGELK